MSLASLATVTAGTKRSVVASTGKRPAPATYLSGLACTPLTPADPMRAGQLMQRLRLETPLALLETIVIGKPDIVQGDVLTVGGEEYVVRGVGAWTPPASMGSFTTLMVEDLRV